MLGALEFPKTLTFRRQVVKVDMVNVEPTGVLLVTVGSARVVQPREQPGEYQCCPVRFLALCCLPRA